MYFIQNVFVCCRACLAIKILNLYLLFSDIDLLFNYRHIVCTFFHSSKLYIDLFLKTCSFQIWYNCTVQPWCPLSTQYSLTFALKRYNNFKYKTIGINQYLFRFNYIFQFMIWLKCILTFSQSMYKKLRPQHTMQRLLLNPKVNREWSFSALSWISTNSLCAL